MVGAGAMSTKAIETRYAGHLFRSRLEARWAAYFDLSGWTWTYEPIDADGYIPDFLIHGAAPMLVEVKPATCAAELKEHTPRIESAVTAHWAGHILMLGVGPLQTPPHIWRNTAVLGLLGERHEPSNDPAFGPYPGGWEWDAAIACLCHDCGNRSIRSDAGAWTSLPCGFYEGNNSNWDGPKADVHELWGQAHEMTRWTGRP